MGRKRKNFKAAAPVVIPTGAEALALHSPLAEVDLPKNPSGANKIELGHWFGKGIDDWVTSCSLQLRAFIQAKTVAPTSVVSYGKALNYFFDYLVTGGALAGPAGLTRGHLDQYVGWLKAGNGPRSEVSQKNAYTHTKSVLQGLLERRVIEQQHALFPANPFPLSNSKKRGQIPLSQAERVRLADALRLDVIALHNDTFDATDGQALTVYALALAMRTGLNTTPLLELKRDCLKPHPFMPRMRLIEAFKGRGNATQIKALRYTRSIEVPTSIPMDGVALFEHLLKRTEPLVANAPENLKDSVWLYEAQASAYLGNLTRLNSSVLGYNVARFVSRHGLLGDDGSPLALNTSRLRKTMENRLWRLSNGDLFTVAAIMGHSPKVADQSYLSVTDEMRKNAVVVGEALPETYRTAKGPTPPPLERTPSGRCKDSLHGDRAPKDGTHCIDFLSCFSCRSFAVVGTSEDLHRLFSFYWFLESESKHTRSPEWAEYFTLIRTQIDLFTMEKFDEELVDQAKQAARSKPLKFWSRYRISGGALA
ncbi:MAG: hypothetical protein AB7P76_13170 [Candidatus Melainabacteria bacterium]|jgi:hypothetical protein